MKKFLSVLLAVSLVLCVFAGCEKKENNDYKIGLAAPDADHGWVAGVAYYAEKYCKENGIEYKLTTSSDKESMEKCFNELSEWGADAVVVWPQWEGMESGVKELIENDIPVISFDVDINVPDVYKITGDNFNMGYECAKYITEKVGNGAYIAVLSVPSAGSVSDLRKEGFETYLEETGYDTSNVFYVEEEGFSRDNGYEDMKKLLDEHEKIDAVFSMDDENSIGIVKAISEAGRTDVKAVTGGGGMQEYFNMIKDSRYSSLGLASALYNPSMVEDAVETAIKALSGKKPGKIVVIPTTVVNKDNVDDYLDAQNTVY